MSDQNTQSAQDVAQPTHQGRLATTALALIAVLFIAVNVLSSTMLTSNRLDLTQEKLYTLSDATLRLAAKIDEPITFRLFYSKSLGVAVPGYAIYQRRVRDLLTEYVNASDGKVQLEIYDPQPFSDIEDRAVAYGLQAVPLDNSKAKVFFGLVGTNTTDDVELIGFLQPERESFLEYDISRMLLKLSNPRKTVLGVISTLPINGTVRMNALGQQEQVPPMIITDQMREIFETRFLPTELAALPADVNLLMVVHPKGLSDKTLFAIDQYVLAGGKAMVLVDPFAELEAFGGQQLQGPGIQGSDLKKLFSAWGLEMDISKVAGDRLTAREVSPGGGRRLIGYVAWLMMRGPNLDRGSPITAGIDSVAVASAGFLKVKEGAGIEMAPLLTTSPGSMIIDAKLVKGFRDPGRLLRDYKPGSEQLVVAGRITGSVKTAFPDGPPKDKDAKAETGEVAFLQESAKPLDVIVVADADILGDRFWVTVRDFFGRRMPVPLANNGDFVMNALEGLVGGSALMELRGRGSSTRPFEVLQAIDREAARKFQKKERKLRKTLENTEKKLQELRQRNPAGSGALLISDADRAAIEKYQRSILALRAELRAVQRSVREDKDRLERELWFYNIAGVPILVALFALVLSAFRARRRRNRAHEAAAG